MKKCLNGRIYDTEKMECLASHSFYSNGNYAGSSRVCVTKSGRFAMVIESNGQDLYRHDDIWALAKEEIAETIDGWGLTDEEEAALVRIGILQQA